MKTPVLFFLSLISLVSACHKKTQTPLDELPATPPITNDLLFYIAGEGPVALNSFGQIYKNENGAETQITNGNYLYAGCSVNKAKTRIACLRALNKNITKKELVVMDIDGGNETVVVPCVNTFSWTNISSIQWSGKGNSILLIASGRIAVINSDGTNPHFISKILYVGPNAFMYDCSSPCLSPDGNKIAYIRRPICDSELVTIDNVTQKLPINGELYVASVNAELDSLSDEKRLTNNGYNLREHSPAWSSDGKKIVYCQSTQNSNASKIYSCDVTGNGLKLLLNDGNDNAYTKWSEDGTRVYFQAYNFTSLNGSIASCNAIDGYAVKIILNGSVTKQYKEFCNIKN